MKWTEIREIVEALVDNYPEVNPEKILFTDLQNKVLTLAEFNDDPKHCNERVLEAIQQLWIDET